MKCAIYLIVIYPMQLWWYWSWYLFINQAFDLPSFFKQLCFGFKLQRAAHVHNISSICCSNETGRLFFSILKLLIQLIARSTWILRLATYLVFFNLSKSHLTFHWCTWWDFKATDMKELFFFNLKASSCHYLIASFQNIVFSYVFVWSPTNITIQ